MDKLERMKEEARTMKLPPGFRFRPTDEELVVQYLRRKAFACPLPADVIPEIDLRKHDPLDLLPGVWRGERYFFHLRQTTHRNPAAGTVIRPATSSGGYWKSAGADKPVIASRSNQLVGMKKTLVFYQGRPRRNGRRRSDWRMHEYHLAGAGLKLCNFTQRSSMIQAQDWVVCKIFRKKKRSRDVDLMNREGGEEDRSSSSSESSCVTQISDQCSEGEEGSSSTTYVYGSET